MNNDARLVILWLAVAAITFALISLVMEVAALILRRRIYRTAVKARMCQACKNRGTTKCPDRLKCLETKDKPYFEKEGWKW